MHKIQMITNDIDEKNKLETWIQQEFPSTFQVVYCNKEVRDPKILIVEINKLFDWVKIHRIKKKNNEILIFPLLNQNMLHTVPLAMQLELQYVFVKPLKKNLFLRSIKRVLKHENLSPNEKKLVQDVNQVPKVVANEALQEVFLRRLIRGDVVSEQEIIDTKLFSSQHPMPNIVYFIQGFVKDSTREEREGWQAPNFIQKSFRDELSKEAVRVYFIPYRRHLLMLLRLPSTFVSPRNWKQGEELILQVIQDLQERYGIHLYIGVGSIYSEPLQLHHSFSEARQARRTPPYQRLSLRYFEETAKEKHIQESIDYILKYYTEDLSVKRVAAHINFSPTYFSRMFKKETGRSFVEYVTFVRLQRAICLLRHTDLTIEQIAEELAFNTPNYFSNIFKKYVGLTPSDYRATKEIFFY